MDDDGSPVRALDIAGQAVRDFNHRSSPRFTSGTNGWEYPSDAYRALAALAYLAERLPQAFDHIARALRRHLDTGQVGIDAGTRWAGNPDGAVITAELALQDAVQAAHQLYAALTEAQSAINAAHRRDGAAGGC
jgi:hypothetical protein